LGGHKNNWVGHCPSVATGQWWTFTGNRLCPVTRRFHLKYVSELLMFLDEPVTSILHACRRGFTIRLKRLKPRGPEILGVRTICSISVSDYICSFVLVQRIGVGASKFLRVKRILTQFPQICPKTSLFDFLQTLGAIF